MAMNKKGFLISLLVLMIVGFVCVLFFGGYMYAHRLINTELLNIPTSEGINVSEAAAGTFNYVNSGLNGLKLISAMMMIGFIFATIIMAYFAREMPIMIMVYFLVVVILIVFSVYISNTYETILNDSVIGSTLAEFSTTNYMILHLPFFIGLFGLLGIFIALSGVYIFRRGE